MGELVYLIKENLYFTEEEHKQYKLLLEEIKQTKNIFTLFICKYKLKKLIKKGKEKEIIN